MVSGEMIIPVFVGIFLAVIVFGANRFFREEDMGYPRVYTFWLFHVVTALLGVVDDVITGRIDRKELRESLKGCTCCMM